MSWDVFFALIQIPSAAVLAVIYITDARRAERKTYRRMFLSAISMIAVFMLGWRLGTLSEIIEFGYRMQGGQALQTLLLWGFIMAHPLLKDRR